MIQRDNLKEYFERARTWEHNELRSAIRSKRLAWLVAGISSIGMIVSVGAVAALAPLKELTPFLIRVDNTTGIVDTVASLKDAPITLDDAMSRYFIGKYVTNRESYSRETAPTLYATVANMSASDVQQSYANWISPTNPNSPQNIYSARTKVSVQIVSVQLVRQGLASVRYKQTVEVDNSRSTRQYVATVVYQLLPEAQLSIQQRLINPVAFAVTEYRTDPEDMSK